MKNKIEEILKFSYNRDSDSRHLVSAVLLEQLFTREVLDFVDFLRENYDNRVHSTDSNMWLELRPGYWRHIETDDILSTEEILKIFKSKL